MAPTGAAATVLTTADAMLPPPAALHQINISARSGPQGVPKIVRDSF